MLKLSSNDTAGERALRVVAYFDQLAIHRPGLEAIVRSTAVLADCPAGLRLSTESAVIRSAPDGTLKRDSGQVRSTSIRVDTGGGIEGEVWLERQEGDGDLDDFILERMAIVIAAYLQRRGAVRELARADGLSDPALAHVLVNERANEPERARAARLMGLDPASMVQLVAVSAQFNVATEVTSLAGVLRQGWGRRVHVSQLSRDVALVVVVGASPVDWSAVAIDGRASSGPVVEVQDAPQSWRAAREGLRFAGLGASWPRCLQAADLGALRLIASIDPSTSLRQPDVARVQELYDAPGGDESIRLLDHFLHADSVRSAARAVNYHHTSFQARIDRIAQYLGIDVKSPGGKQRVTFALLLWQLNHE